MKREPILALTMAAALSLASLAQSASDPDLSGTWVNNSNSSDKIVLTEKGETIQLHESDGDKVVTDYTCKLTGRQCEIKEDGHSAEVMLYYNGSKLIEITQRSSDVTKRRFSLSGDGKTLTMEVIPISSEGKTVTQTFHKQDTQIASGN